MKKKIGNNALFYLICLVVSCLLNLAASALMIKIVNLFIEVAYCEASVIRIASSLLINGLILGAVSWYESHHSVEFEPLTVVASLSIASLIHLLLCVVLMFTPFMAGGVRDLAGVLTMGDGFNSKSMIEEITLWTYLLSYGIFFVLEMAVCLTLGWFGMKQRLRERENLHHKEDDSTTPNAEK